MAIDPQIALQVRPAQVESPLDAFSKSASVADVLSQMQERQSIAAERQAQAPLRAAQAAAQQKQFAESGALKQALEGSVTYNSDLGDIDYDDPKAAQILHSYNMDYLLPQYQSQKDQARAAHRTQALNELDQTQKVIERMATPAENFLALPPEKRPAAYPALRSAMLTNPANGKLMPNSYDPDTVDKLLQSVVDQHDQTKDIQEKLKDAQTKQGLSLQTPEGREAEINAQIQQFSKQNGGKTPDQETLDAIREGVMNKAGFSGFKIARKAPGALKQFGDTEGPNLPQGATGIYGEQLDRTPGIHYATVMHPDGSIIGYVQNNKQFAPKSPTAASLALAQANGDDKAAAALQALGKLRASQSGSSAGLTPEAVNMIARQFVATGTMPSMGMGAAKDREAILNEAGKIAGGQNIAANSAEFKQLQGSTSALQKSRDAVVAFETTATKNLDNAIAAAKKLEDTGSPILNKPLRSIDRSALGSPEVAAFDAARQVAVNEIAKVTSSPSLSGQLSDSARQEIANFIPQDATIQQIMAVAQILKIDMENRRTALEDQIKFNNGRIKGVGATTPAQNAPPNPYTPPPLKLSPNNPYAKKSPSGD